MMTLHTVLSEQVDSSWYKPLAITEQSILIYLSEGKMSYEVEGQRVELEKGEVLYVSPGQWRSGQSDPVDGHQKYAFFFDLPAGHNALPVAHGFCKIRLRAADYFHQRFVSLLHQWLAAQPHYRIICQGIVLEMLGMLRQEMEPVELPAHKLVMAASIREHILAHYREPLRIEELAGLVAKSPNYVIRVFREVTGQTPIDYLHRIRMQAAADLFRHSSMTVSQISDYLGYCDPAYFNRVFRRLTGRTPTGYRQEQQAAEGRSDR